jgi:autotransporter-associated beta strand protein
MNRSSLNELFGLRRSTRQRPRQLAFEPLEERRLLTAYNLLVSTFDDSAGSSVLNYSEATKLRLPGGVYTGDHGLGEAEGLAVAADGSYYVSNLLSGGLYGGQVLHYSKSGVFLNVLGASDAVHAPIAAPGALAFGPNGNLYAADLYTNAILQFNVNSTAQQYQSANTLWLPANFMPGGFTFAADGTNDLIVGGLGAQAVLRYHNGTSTTLIEAGSSIDASSILALSNGKLLIADFDLDGDASAHHQILEYDAGQVTQFIDLSLQPPYGTGASANDPAQPLSMIFDADGNLLVGVSPDHNGNGAVLKFNINTGAPMDTLATGIGTPSGLALTPVLPADLLIGTYDSTAGMSAVRFSTTAQAVVGGAATGDNGLGETNGVAVAPDGSYYVSNLLSGGVYGGQVLHFNSAGVFLNVLGAGDAVHAPIAAPGTLAFGPNGNLYVADLYSSAIFQFDIRSTTQQYQAAGTLSLPTDFSPGGFTFAPNITHDLIVGNLNAQSIVEFHSGGTSTTLVQPGSGYNPLAILALSNGNLLIADSDLGYDPMGHHQIAAYDAGAGTIGQFINLTAPVGTGQFADDPPQPTSLLLDTDGNLLVGLSPDHNGNGAVEKFDITTKQLLSTVVSSIGSPAGLAFAPLQMVIPAAAWSSAGLTIARSGDGMSHVYSTGTTTDVVAPLLAASLGGIEIRGLANSSETLTIDESGGDPIPSDGIAFVNGVGCSYAVQSGTISAALTGVGGLTKTGAGTATLSGSNDYQGETAVTAGTLIVTSAGALHSGSALAVGANLSAFSSPVVPAAPATTASAAAAVSLIAPLATSSNSIGTGIASEGVVKGSRLRDVLFSKLAAAESPRPASVPAGKSYNDSTATVGVRQAAAAACVAWWTSTSSSSSFPNTPANDRRMAALDAVLAEYDAA